MSNETVQNHENTIKVKTELYILNYGPHESSFIIKVIVFSTSDSTKIKYIISSCHVL